MVYDLQQYLEDNYMSWDQVEAGYYDKNDCDSKFALKSDIPTVVQSDKVVGDATKLVPSLAYVVNTYTTQTVTNILSNQVSACGSQLTTLNNKFNNYVLKSEYDALKSKLDSLEARLASLENSNSTGNTSADLSSYATKSDLTQYRKLNDLSYHNHLELPIINKEVFFDDDDEPYRFTTSHIPYHDGTHLIGKYTDYDGIEHSFDTIFNGTVDGSDDFYQNCMIVFKQSKVNESLYVDWDPYTGAVYLMDENQYYMGCEITSAILDEDLSLSTNNDLSKYCTINELRRYGLGEIQPVRTVTLPFELSLVNGKQIQFKYNGSSIAVCYSRINMLVWKDLIGNNHFILFDFVHRVINYDGKDGVSVDIPPNNTYTTPITETFNTYDYETTPELVSNFEYYRFKTMNYLLADKLIALL
ncbi:hypothetical protein M9Y10_022200 [Tritrichomonas musculus]|uniref:Uncharacterized protein n=1 Tax=Tritrichomonas musculus TaxID=1915356 RepID=A0ABR2KRW2_9EUKA